VNRFRDELNLQGIGTIIESCRNIDFTRLTEASLAFVTPTDQNGVVITGQEHHRVHEQVAIS
jgi:hypothetical protein